MRTHISGPFDATGGAVDNNPIASPSTFSQGWALRDPRSVYANGEREGPRCVIDSGNFIVADLVPPALGAAVLAAAATGTSGTALTLVSSSANGVYVNIPLVPFGKGISSANVVKVIALGPGHTTGNTTAGSASIASVGSTAGIMLGSWICIAEGAAAGQPWITQVKAKTETTLTTTTNVPASVTGAAIFLMDPTGTTVVTSMRMGLTDIWNGGAAFDSVSGVGRAVSVTSNNVSDTGWTANVVAYDPYRVPLTIAQAVTANSTVYSTKTVKFIGSVTPSKSGTTAGTLSVGVGDVFGLAFFCDRWEHLRVYWAGALVTGSPNGFTAGSLSTPSGTTGDVRGTIQTGAAGAGTGIGANASDGTRRLVIHQAISPQRLRNGTVVDLIGLTQA